MNVIEIWNISKHIEAIELKHELQNNKTDKETVKDIELIFKVNKIFRC